MQVVCEIMRLKPECVKEYISLHENTWPELIAAIRNSGFMEEYIYMLDTLVIVIMKCEDFKNSVERLLSTAIFQKWTAQVRGMLMSDEALFRTSEKIIDLLPIWNLSDFPDRQEGIQ